MSEQKPTIKQMLAAAASADWTQVALNGGPPCFHMERNRFCLRAERWAGHGSADHAFVSLADLIARLALEAPHA